MRFPKRKIMYRQKDPKIINHKGTLCAVGPTI